MYDKTPVIESMVKLKRHKNANRRAYNYVYLDGDHAYWTNGHLIVREECREPAQNVPLEGAYDYWGMRESDEALSDMFEKIRDVFEQYGNGGHHTEPSLLESGEDLYAYAREARPDYAQGNRRAFKLKLFSRHSWSYFDPTFIFDFTRRLRKADIKVSASKASGAFIFSWQGGQIVILPIVP